MSIKRTTDVWELSRATGSTLLILLALADQADESGIFIVDIPTLARLTRLGEQPLEDRLQRLAETGELLVSRRGRQVVGVVTVGLSEGEIAQARQRAGKLFGKDGL